MDEELKPAASLLASRKVNDQFQIWYNRVDGQDVIKQLMLLIAGVEVEYTENGNAVLKESSNSIMSLDGATKLHVLLRTLINPVTTLTRFSETDINHHTMVVSNELRIWFNLNYHKYGMDKDFVQTLNTTLDVTVHAQLERSLLGKEAEYVSIEHSRREEKGRLQQETRDLRKSRPMGAFNQ